MYMACYFYECATGHILHMLLHLIGIDHEIMRPDRDSYIKIDMTHVLRKHKYIIPLLSNDFYFSDGEVYFRKQKYYYDTKMPYDFSSIMQNSPFFGTMMMLQSIWPIASSSDTSEEELEEYMGQRRDLSLVDIGKINALYRCPRDSLPGYVQEELDVFKQLYENKRGYYQRGLKRDDAPRVTDPPLNVGAENLAGGRR